MIDQGKKNIIGIQINAIDYQAAVAKIITAAQEQQPMAVSALAVHGVMTGVLDEKHRYRLNQLDLVVPDGQPVRWALNWLYRTGLSDRVYGPTLTLKVCQQAAEKGLPLYFYGSKLNVINALVENLRARFPKLIVAGMMPSRFRQTTPQEKVQIASEIRGSGAMITFVGLGCPRQEVWAYEYRDILAMPVIAVGAAFDFHAGTVDQASPFFQNLGLEWLYRLVQEPRRLWKRYILLNPLYLLLLTAQFLKLKQFDLSKPSLPLEEMRYG